jgi:hypothetical protein
MAGAGSQIKRRPESQLRVESCRSCCATNQTLAVTMDASGAYSVIT